MGPPEIWLTVEQTRYQITVLSCHRLVGSFYVSKPSEIKLAEAQQSCGKTLKVRHIMDRLISYTIYSILTWPHCQQVNKNNAVTLTWSQFKDMSEAQEPQTFRSLGGEFIPIFQCKPSHSYLGGMSQNWWQVGSCTISVTQCDI